MPMSKRLSLTGTKKEPIHKEMNVKRTSLRYLFCLTIVLLSLNTTSCGFLDKLGFDTYDYMSEDIVTIHQTDDETTARLESLLSILITDSTELPLFDNTSTAIKEYRDAVLKYMLNDDYAKYSGNTELIEQANEVYPEYRITQVIPAGEFEATMYRSFGGDVKIDHKDGGKFKYLSAIEAYVSMVDTVSSDYRIEIYALSETEKTYRVRFFVKSSDDQTTSGEYFALVIKREDGTLYIKKLLNGSDIT